MLVSPFYDNERIRSMAELGIHFPSNAPMWHFIVVFTDDRSVQLRPERNGRSVDVYVIREGIVSPPAGKGAAKGETAWSASRRTAKGAAQGNSAVADGGNGMSAATVNEAESAASAGDSAVAGAGNHWCSPAETTTGTGSVGSAGDSAVADEGNRTSAETTRWDGCWQGNANWSRWHFDGNDYSNFHGWHGWQDRHSDGWQRWRQWHSADGWGGGHWDGNNYNSRWDRYDW